MTDREISEAVARKLGWTFGQGENDPEIAWRDPFGSYRNHYPDYCHDIKAAWEIVEWIYVNGGKFLWKSCFGLSQTGNGWDCCIRMTPWQHADTAPMAICLAFLKLQ